MSFVIYVVSEEGSLDALRTRGYHYVDEGKRLDGTPSATYLVFEPKNGPARGKELKIPMNRLYGIASVAS